MPRATTSVPKRKKPFPQPALPHRWVDSEDDYMVEVNGEDHAPDYAYKYECACGAEMRVTEVASPCDRNAKEDPPPTHQGRDWNEDSDDGDSY